MACDACADVGDAEDELPGAGADGAGKIGGGGVGLGEGEGGFVAAAPAAEALGVEEAEVDGGTLVASRCR